MKVTVEELKQHLSGSHVIGDVMYANCPKCGKNEFGISITEDNHPFGCFRKKKCGWTGNIYTLYSFLGVEIKKKININQVENLIVAKTQEEPKKELVLEPIPYPFGWRRLYSNNYLAERGFSADDYEKYEVGEIRLHRGYVFFAVKMWGNLYGYVGRATDARMKQKYLNSITDFGQLLYGYDDVKIGDILCLVEGIFDKKAVDGINGVSCVATFGGHITDRQIELIKLKRVSRVILMHESDILSTVKKEAIKLNRYFNTKVAYIPNGLDPDTMTKGQLLDAINQATTPNSFNIKYVSNDL